MTPDTPRPPRKIALDDQDDVAPCRPPPWVGDVLAFARDRHLHDDQLAALRWLLSSLQIESLEAPALSPAGTGPNDLIVLAWTQGNRSAVVRLRQSIWGHRAVRLQYFSGGHKVVDEAPRDPAGMLRRMLGQVFPREVWR